MCVATNGVGVCQCDEGLVKEQPFASSCVDYNECVEQSPCGEDSTCENSIGGFSCLCNGGFVATGLGVCAPSGTATTVQGDAYTFSWGVACEAATAANISTFRDGVAAELDVNPNRVQVSTVTCQSDKSAVTVSLVFLPPASTEATSVPSRAAVKAVLDDTPEFGSSLGITNVVALGIVNDVAIDGSAGSFYESGVRDDSEGASDSTGTDEGNGLAAAPIIFAIIGVLLAVGLLAFLLGRRKRQVRAQGQRPREVEMNTATSLRARDDYAAPPRKQASTATVNAGTMDDYTSPSAAGRPAKGGGAAFSALGVSVDFLIDGEEITRSAKIGEGAFGLVLKGSWGDKAVAIKEVKGTDKEALRQLLDEGQKLVNIPPHVNLVTFYGVCDDPPAIILQFCDEGSLLDRLYGPRAADNPDLTPTELRAIALGTARGLHHLHHARVIHRDVAARNVLLHDGVAKVTDMGMARDNAGEGTGANYFQQTKTTTGPLKWMAHEQLTARAVSYKADVYSYGIVLFEMWGKEEPWTGMTAIEAAAMVIGGQSHRIPSGTPLLIAATMSACLQKDPHARPSMHRIVEVLDRESDDEPVADATGDNVSAHPDVIAARTKYYAKEADVLDGPDSSGTYLAPTKTGEIVVPSQGYAEPPANTEKDTTDPLPRSESSKRRRKRNKDKTEGDE
jgi:serine/threonine protein kinase